MLGQRVHPWSGLSMQCLLCTVRVAQAQRRRQQRRPSLVAFRPLAGCEHTAAAALAFTSRVCCSRVGWCHICAAAPLAQVWHQLTREQHTLDRPVRQRLVRAIEWLRLKGNNTVHVFGSFFFCSVFYRRTMAYSSFVSLPGVTLTVSSAVGCESSGEVTPFITRFRHIDSRCAWIIPLYN